MFLGAIFCSYLKVENGVRITESEMLDLYTDFVANIKQDGKLQFLEFNTTRFNVFKANVEDVIAHNAQNNKTFTKGINKFSDLTDEEFMRFYVGASQNCSATLKSSVSYRNVTTPENFDWRNYAVVSPVKNQGQCGSCWTFSTTGAIESHYALLNQVYPPSLSEQQLVDCAQAFDNHGCRGGLPSHAFEYIMYNGGLEYESTYRYEAKDGACRNNRTKTMVKVSGGAYNITLGNEVELRDAIYQYGPVSVCYQVVGDFRNYKYGVYSSNVCRNSTMDVNHAVLAVGFGKTQEGVDYWVVKNSWGADWGDQGYFKIKRGVNMCGIAVCNSFPKMDRTQPRAELE
jgi:cathepsin H